jgi:hypothetical protein
MSNHRIVTAEGAVIHSLNPTATIAKLMEAASTPAEYDADTGQKTKAKSYPDAATVYEEVDINEVDLRTHKWLKSRYDSEEWTTLRAKRNALLKDTDWQAGTDVTMTDAQKAYRQKLRDLPATNSDPTKIVFPDAP